MHKTDRVDSEIILHPANLIKLSSYNNEDTFQLFNLIYFIRNILSIKKLLLLAHLQTLSVIILVIYEA